MKKVLVVEDDKFLASAYRVKLAKAGYKVVIVYDGEEALKSIDRVSADLILLDLVLPKRDGFSVLQALKASSSWRSIPVIVATNLGQKEDINRATKLGADDYIVKTDLSMKELIGKINNLIGGSEEEQDKRVQSS